MAKTILITGASSGLGKVIAEYLHTKGYNVYGTSRRITSEGNKFNTLPMDVCDPESIRKAVETIIAQTGKIDVVINNAGLGIAGVSEHISLADAEKVLNTNLLGVIRVCQAALPHMRQNKSGLIINVSSIGSEVGLPYRGIYSASKAAVDRYTEALRIELKPYAIQACTLQPGGVNTDISANRLVSPLPAGSPYQESFKRTYEIINNSVRSGLPPEKFGPVVEKIINSRTVKRNYRIGKPTEKLSVLLKKLLPDFVFEKIIQNHYKV